MLLKKLGSKLSVLSPILYLLSAGHLAGCQKQNSQGSLNDSTSPIINKIQSFADKYRQKKQDVTVVLFDGSISTDMGYASKRPDSSYRPPCTTEFNIPSFIEEKLRWTGQQYRRYDAKKDPNSTSPVFVESGTTITRQFDGAWDWQNKPPQANGYNGLTRIVSGSKPSVSYQFPAEAKRSDFIYRTDYLSSASIKISVAGNLNQVEVFDETDNSWKEAEGFVFSAREKDELISASFYPDQNFGATSLRKSIYQKRLKMRAREGHGNLRISITSQDGGRLCYWGIAYSPLDYMFQFINVARGGHSIADLSNFESWSVDYWKPDLILFSCNTINEGADATSYNNRNSPVVFAGRFENYINHFLAKDYHPDFFAYILFTARAQGLVNDQDVVGTAHIIDYGDATVFDFINELQKRFEKMPIAYASAFEHFVEVGKANAVKNHTKAYDEYFGNAIGPLSKGFVGDYTHLNNYGARVGWEYLEPFFNF